MKHLANFFNLFMSLSLLITIGCPGPLSYDKAAADKQAANAKSLMELMDKHPDFANASLKDIRDAAANGTNTTNFQVNPDDEDLSLKNNNAAPSLDKTVAAEIQGKIDEVRKNFSFKHYVNSGFKVFAVFSNFKDANNHEEKEPAAGAPAPASDGPKEKSENKAAFPRKKMTCPEIEAKPYEYLGISKKDFDEGMTKGQKIFEERIDGCATMLGNEFAKCMIMMQEATYLLFENADCNIKSQKELEDKISKAAGKNFNELNKEAKDCIDGPFKKCGFFDPINKGEADENDEYGPREGKDATGEPGRRRPGAVAEGDEKTK